MKPFRTYPEDRVKLLDLARKCERSDDANAIELGDLVRAILEDEAVAESGGWIAWAGGDCPVHPDTMVNWRINDPDVDNLLHETDNLERRAGSLWWGTQGAGDIIAYRVVTPTAQDAGEGVA